MDKNKGLADNHDGEFILNESGTSVTIDADAEYPEDKTDKIEEEVPASKDEKQVDESK